MYGWADTGQLQDKTEFKSCFYHFCAVASGMSLGGLQRGSSNSSQAFPVQMSQIESLTSTSSVARTMMWSKEPLALLSALTVPTVTTGYGKNRLPQSASITDRQQMQIIDLGYCFSKSTFLDNFSALRCPHLRVKSHFEGCPGKFKAAPGPSGSYFIFRQHFPLNREHATSPGCRSQEKLHWPNQATPWDCFLNFG